MAAAAVAAGSQAGSQCLGLILRKPQPARKAALSLRRHRERAGGASGWLGRPHALALLRGMPFSLINLSRSPAWKQVSCDRHGLGFLCESESGFP